VHYWDEIAETQDALPAGWRRHARAEHLRLVAAWADVRGRWLKTDLFEERAAERALLPALATAAWIGIDVSGAVAAQARAHTASPVTVADVRALPFRPAAFDGALSTSTLDHFDQRSDITAALREIRRVLVPGGRLILTLDNPRNPLVWLRNALPPSIASRTGLVPFAVGETLDAREGRDALVASGFAVDAVTHLLHAPHVAGTRPARFGWYERSVLPRTERLGRTRLAPFSGHFVAFSARAV
jgi:ubiquinone/menaquinone biosynthesis C-methylase UbiE